jgi:hypothetical protein
LVPPDARVVLVDSSRVRQPLLSVVEEACHATRARCLPWAPDRPLDQGVVPAVVVSLLAAGERKIPDALAQLMTSDFPGLPLLLLSTDELVRPTISLQEGRVTLLGAPHAAERISTRLRILLADQDVASAGTMPFGVGARSLCHVHERSISNLYIGTVSRSSGGEPKEHAPLVEVSESGSMTALLSLSGAPGYSHLSAATSVLGSDETDHEKEEQLSALIGAPTALVHCEPSLEWSAHWPDPTCGLVLASPNRLPSTWSFSDALGRSASTFVRVQGASADVVVALWGLPWSARGFPPMRLLEAAQVGGPCVLDALVEALNSAEQSATALVLEFR